MHFYDYLDDKGDFKLETLPAILAVGNKKDHLYRIIKLI
jgi:hypothetical protein